MRRPGATMFLAKRAATVADLDVGHGTRPLNIEANVAAVAGGGDSGIGLRQANLLFVVSIRAGSQRQPATGAAGNDATGVGCNKYPLELGAPGHQYRYVNERRRHASEHAVENLALL